MNIQAQQAEDYLSQAQTLFKKGQYNLAKETAQKAVILFKKLDDYEPYLYARNIVGSCLGYMSNFDEALSYIHQTKVLCLTHLSESHTLYSRTHAALGYCYLSKSQFQSARTHLEETLRLQLTYFGATNPQTINAYFSLGKWHGLKGNIDKELFFLKKALAILQANPKDKEAQIAYCHNNIGLLYPEIGKPKEGLIYLQKALNSRRTIFGEMHAITARTYNNIACAYWHLSDLEEAIVYFNKALTIRLQVLGEAHPEVAQNYRNLGRCHEDTGHIKIALENIQKALSSFKSIFGEKHPQTALTYQAIGGIYEKQSKTKNSLTYYKKTLEIQYQVLGSYHPETAKTHLFIANNSTLPKSLNEYQKALHSLFPNFNYKTVYDRPIIPPNTQVEPLLRILCCKGQTFFTYYKTTQNLKDLETSLHIFDTAVQLIDHHHQSFRSEGSKLVLSDNALSVYQGGLEANYMAWETYGDSTDAAKVFEYSEKAKGAILLGAIQDMAAKKASTIPAELLEKEKDLKRELAFLDKQSQGLQQKASRKPLSQEEQALLVQMQNEFFDLHQAYTDLMMGFEKNYPDYFQLKYKTQTATVEDIQAALQEAQTLVSYFIGQTSIYILVVTADDFLIEELQKPADLAEQIADLMKAIRQHRKTQYLQLAHALYRLLIAPVEMYLEDPMTALLGESSTLPKLVIIPHAELTYLPFEALLASYPHFSENQNPQNGRPAAASKSIYPDLDYLLHHYAISYHYSATLWLQQAQKTPATTPQTDSFVGFAPIYSPPQSADNEAVTPLSASNTRHAAAGDLTDWQSLPHSKQEVESIAQLFTQKGLAAKTYLRTDASIANFSTNCQSAKYLLIAAHGLVNDKKPVLSGLVFHPSVDTATNGLSTSPTGLRSHAALSALPDYVLSMEDMYQLRLNADLVVLSTCESAIGKLAKGEGMIAINRGFLYAGAKNVVSTLFKVYDKSSSELTQYLFEFILNGDSYVAALRKAKLKLVAQKEVSPASWAAFVLIGN